MRNLSQRPFGLLRTGTVDVALPAGMTRADGELDRAQVVAGVHNLARRRMTMRDLAAELGVAVPSVYYHVPGKQAALDLLADSLLAEIPVPAAGRWDLRLIEPYYAAREVILRVPGVARMLQTRRPGESACRLDGLSRLLLAEAGLAKAPAAAAHTCCTHVPAGLGNPEGIAFSNRGRTRQSSGRRALRAGPDVIVAGIHASAVW